MMRRSLAPGALAGLGILTVLAACSKSASHGEDGTASSPSPPQPAATATASGVTTPPPAETEAPSPAPVVVLPPEPSAAPGPVATAAPHAPAARPAPPPKAYAPHANKPTSKPDDDGPHSTPAPNLGVKKVAVLANNHYTCSSTEKRDNVAAVPEPRGARISIVGQGPCPGEVHDWSASVTQSRVEVHGTHGSTSKCRCMGSGELVLRGLDPGTYEIAVNGGFDRPIATRITVLQ